MRNRTPEPEPETATPRRLTLSQIVEQLLQRGSSEHSSVTLSRNSKGETQIEVVVRTGDAGDIVTIEEAEQAAQAVYDRLRVAYHFGAGNGTSEPSS